MKQIDRQTDRQTERETNSLTPYTGDADFFFQLNLLPPYSLRLRGGGKSKFSIESQENNLIHNMAKMCNHKNVDVKQEHLKRSECVYLSLCNKTSLEPVSRMEYRTVPLTRGLWGKGKSNYLATPLLPCSVTCIMHGPTCLSHFQQIMATGTM